MPDTTGLPLQRGPQTHQREASPAEAAKHRLMSKHEPRPSQAAAGSRTITGSLLLTLPRPWDLSLGRPQQLRSSHAGITHHGGPGPPVLQKLWPPSSRLWGSPAGAGGSLSGGHAPCPGPSVTPGDAGDTRRGDLTGASLWQEEYVMRGAMLPLKGQRARVPDAHLCSPLPTSMVGGPPQMMRGSHIGSAGSGFSPASATS